MSKWIAEYELEDGDTMPEHMNLEYKGVRIDFHCKPLEQPSTTKNDLGVDCISRQAVIDEMEKRHTEGDCITKGFIKNMPSVTPIRPKGHWIWCVGSHKCSNCEEYTCFSHKNLLRYCPNCGADMREVVEE